MKYFLFDFKKTCRWMPEQYDIYYHEHQVGYLRLRNGWLELYRDAGDDDYIFSANLGEKNDGEFENEEVRTFWLSIVGEIMVIYIPEHLTEQYTAEFKKMLVEKFKLEN